MKIKEEKKGKTKEKIRGREEEGKKKTCYLSKIAIGTRPRSCRAFDGQYVVLFSNFNCVFCDDINE